MIYELRRVPPGAPIPLRQPDLAALADALGGTPESIETRLMQLGGVSHEEAVRLRSMILPPLSLPSPVRDASHDDPYALLNQADDSPAIEQFFAGPGPVDPFAPAAGDPFAGGPATVDPFTGQPATAEPFGAPPASPVDPFATAEPFGAPPRPRSTRSRPLRRSRRRWHRRSPPIPRRPDRPRGSRPRRPSPGRRRVGHPRPRRASPSRRRVGRHRPRRR